MNGFVTKMRTRPRRGHRGFTAVEIAMVATVIAIISLLILPIYRDRVEAARQAAVVDELSSIAKAQLLIEADTGMQARLQDLDNNDSTTDANGVPIAAWNGTLEVVVPKARATLIPGADGDTGWQGPYASTKKYKNVGDLQDYWLNSPTTGIRGFIYVVGNGQGVFGPDYPGTPAQDDLNDFLAHRYPVDPWGQPYVFYGVGRFPNNASTESSFNSSVAYSLGRDGLPGNEIAPFINPDAYRRFEDGGVLGLGDDIEYRF